jgi:predicted phosphodiesterase
MDYWEEAYDFNKKFKAEAVYSTGDFADQYTLSRFPKATNSENGRTEILRCIPQIKTIGKMFRNLKIMRGNHDMRINKRAQEAGIDGIWINDFMNIVGAPKTWEWIKQDYIRTGPGILLHGFLSNREKHALWFNDNVVHGHLHAKLGIEYFQRDRKKIWVMCVGAMADRNAMALQYGPLSKFSTMTCGMGYSDEDGHPHLYPFKG